ncbi:hypothetical protein ACFLU0_01755 [Chloroflexota bacterium]
MKHKRYSLLLIGLVLILATSIVACDQTAPTATTQSIPRTLTQIGGSLIIPLKVGERVEIEVTKGETGRLFSSVTDPYGNKIAESAWELQVSQAISLKTGGLTHIKRNLQEYPWRFAFIAATGGNYILEGDSTSTLKAVIYP